MAAVNKQDAGFVLHPQYLVDASQKTTAVLININEWNCVLEALEELDDIRAYDAAKLHPQDFVDFEDAVNAIEANEKQ